MSESGMRCNLSVPHKLAAVSNHVEVQHTEWSENRDAGYDTIRDMGYGIIAGYIRTRNYHKSD